MSRTPLPVVLVVALAVPAWAGPAGRPAAAPPEVPEGFVQMTVAGVMQTEGGHAVVLKQEQPNGALLPIWIGDAEAFSIQLRLERRRFQRPLTHDLLDTIMQKLGGRLVKIQVDDLKTNTFVGTVFILQGKTVHAIDARPSDSIALALGSQVPIFVAKKVLDRAGVRPDQDQPAEPESSDPEKLLEDILDADREEHTL